MRKVLWVINTLNPSVATEFNYKSSHSISWVEAMADRIKTDSRLKLSIAAPGNICELQYMRIDSVDYYLVPSKNSYESWSELIDRVEPDIIHIYGTEKEHAIDVERAAKEIPVLISLQGILSEYYHHYYAGIDHRTMLRYTPIRDIIRPSGFFTGKRDFEKRAKIEKKILLQAKYVEGRSTWDRVSARNINPNLKYFYCPRMIRRPFYESEKWDVNEVERHTIFISQGDYPIKGIHFVFLAVEKLVKKYPDIRIVVTGNNMFQNVVGVRRLLRTGYQRYLFDLAKKTGVMNYITFVGYKNAQEMADLLRSVHVAVVPSSIENAPNSLAEAMLMGTPCIASFVGGNMDMLKHDEEGFLYCFNEPNMLAEYIDRIFSSDMLAEHFSHNAMQTAQKRHDPDLLVENLNQIYETIIRKVGADDGHFEEIDKCD